MRYERIEPLKNYNFFGNDDNEILLMLPGYYKGKPTINELHYAGGRNAILYRSEGQQILLDSINPEVVKILRNIEKILVGEMDTGQEYYAVITADRSVERYAELIYDMHAYNFKYNTFPAMNGSLDVGVKTCECCGNETKLSYSGPIYPDMRTVTLCPECIQTGRAADKLGGKLIEASADIPTDAEVIEKRTVPYYAGGKGLPVWPHHCDEYCIYLGQPEPEDYKGNLAELIAGIMDSEGKDIPADRQKEVLEKLRAGTLTGYLFRCSVCEDKLIVIENDTI